MNIKKLTAQGLFGSANIALRFQIIYFGFVGGRGGVIAFAELFRRRTFAAVGAAGTRGKQ
jgi:hypothetical protein